MTQWLRWNAAPVRREFRSLCGTFYVTFLLGWPGVLSWKNTIQSLFSSVQETSFSHKMYYIFTVLNHLLCSNNWVFAVEMLCTYQQESYHIYPSETTQSILISVMIFINPIICWHMSQICVTLFYVINYSFICTCQKSGCTLRRPMNVGICIRNLM